MSGNRDIFPDAVLRLDRIPAGGRNVSIVADDEALQQLLQRFKVDAVESVGAELHAMRLHGGLHVTGRVRAEIVQPCVVTFDPVRQVIDEKLDRVFLPASQRPKDPEPGSEAFVDLEGDDPPDYFEGNEVDLTELVIEALALAIDPYPRSPGAEDALSAIDEAPEETSPFAKLKDLKSKRKSQ